MIFPAPRLLASLSLEAIGDDAPPMARIPGKQPWVARITGLDARYGLRREFVRGKKDYRDGNSVGSRGVRWYYLLEPGVYEVNAPVAWQRVDRYFVASHRGEIVRIDRAAVERWFGSREMAWSMGGEGT